MVGKGTGGPRRSGPKSPSGSERGQRFRKGNIGRVRGPNSERIMRSRKERARKKTKEVRELIRTSTGQLGELKRVKGVTLEEKREIGKKISRLETLLEKAQDCLNGLLGNLD